MLDGMLLSMETAKVLELCNALGRLCATYRNRLYVKNTSMRLSTAMALRGAAVTRRGGIYTPSVSLSLRLSSDACRSKFLVRVEVPIGSSVLQNVWDERLPPQQSPPSTSDFSL